MSHELKSPRIRFISHAPGYWPDVPAEKWNDWKWQLKNRVSSLAKLEQLIAVTSSERAGALLAGSKLSLSVTPHFFNLIEAHNPDCPIRRQVIPRMEEGYTAPWEMADPCGEDSHMPVPGLVHRYPDRVLFLVTDRCASYCRYCTRSRVVSGAGEQELHTDFDEAFAYLQKHTEVRDVLFSGGDPLLFSDEKLEYSDWQGASDSSYRVCPHWNPCAGLSSATHHPAALPNAAKVSSALDERACQPPAGADARSSRSSGASCGPRNSSWEPERAACRGQR